MQESKKRIVIASILKPVDDTRMFEKMAQSLSNTGKYEIHVIGFPSKTTISSSIKTHPSQHFKRLSFRRLVEPWHILKKIWHIKPQILIVNSHELLGASVTLKFLLGCKVIYDVQENYFRNILFTKAFPSLVRPLIASYVRLKEISLSPIIDYFILAEKGYEKELRFIGRKKIVIENKVVRPDTPSIKKKSNSLIRLLFSGTLAESTGVFSAIAFTKKLYLLEPNIRLTIIGFCSQQEAFKKIKKEIEYHKAIRLIGGDELVPHQMILEEMQHSDFGIISYPSNPSTKNAIPTKLYEYLGYELPILLTDFQPWRKVCAPYNASLNINFDQYDASTLLYQMKHSVFYSTKPENVFWESENLVSLIDNLI